ncbi:hypothetical protein BT69DRAFT_1349389 [Atractiella rhizophila]|nr:hypothetical protein BT69DRAFT_1349389 [Atractiella rhizophila]
MYRHKKALSLTLTLKTSEYARAILASSTVHFSPQSIQHGARVRINDPAPSSIQKKVHGVQLAVKNVAEVLFSEKAWERRVLYERNIKWDGAGGVELGGRHGFEFIFALPANLAASEDGRWGRVRLEITASASYEGPFGEARIDVGLPLHAIVNPHPHGEAVPASLTFVTDHTDDLGVFNVTYSSPNLTVGSCILFAFKLPCLPRTVDGIRARVRIETLTLALLQQVVLESVDGEGKEKTEDRFVLIENKCVSPASTPGGSRIGQGLGIGRKRDGMGCGAIALLAEGEEWEYSRVVQLSRHDSLSPSTHANTVTPIRLSHAFELRLTYSILTSQRGGTEEWKTRRLVNKKECFLASCRLSESILTLPPYSRFPPHDRNGELIGTTTCACACAMEKEQVQQSIMHGRDGGRMRAKWEDE